MYPPQRISFLCIFVAFMRYPSMCIASVNAHQTQSRAQTADRAAQTRSRPQPAVHAGYSEQQLSPQSGWGEAGSQQPDWECHLNRMKTHKRCLFWQNISSTRINPCETSQQTDWPLKAPSMAWRYAWRTRDVDVLRVKAFLNHSLSSEGTSTVKRPVHWDNTDTACTSVPSWTATHKHNSTSADIRFLCMFKKWKKLQV